MNQSSAKNLSYGEVNHSSFIKNFKSGKKISEILHEARYDWLKLDALMAEEQGV